VGVAAADRGDLAGGDAAVNAGRLLAILAGSDRGPAAGAVALNAGAALVVAGLAPNLGEGVEQARECLGRGAPAALLERVVARARGTRS
jgi:anthranilate phosphoribosyltransferase